MSNLELTQEKLKELITYNPDTGEFSRKDGSVLVRYSHSGYAIGSILGTVYYANRLAYLYVTGAIPKEEIKFKDRNPKNLKFSNLYLYSELPSFDDMAPEMLKELLHYDRKTGKLIWTDHFSNQAEYVGQQAGSLHSTERRYVTVRDSKRILEHRLIWFMEYGEWPENEIDHINGIKHDNRLENLRLATRKQNSQNYHRANKNGATGLLGVSYKAKKGKYTAQITINRKAIHLGTFTTAEQAHEAYLAAKRKFHEFNTL
jgi:hypothetical protein